MSGELVSDGTSNTGACARNNGDFAVERFGHEGSLLVDHYARQSKSKAFGVLAFDVRRYALSRLFAAQWIGGSNTQHRTAKTGDFAYFQPMSLTILSIQSSVAYGHVGNNAAVFPLQRIGVEVWPVNTVHFSNHTGYGSWRGLVLPVESVAEVIRGIEERKVLPRCAGVLSGYMGDVSLGTVVLDAVAKVRAANPDAVYCCDPVMGDVGRGFFVRPGIPEFMKDHAVPAATMVTPNQC